MDGQQGHSSIRSIQSIGSLTASSKLSFKLFKFKTSESTHLWQPPITHSRQEACFPPTHSSSLSLVGLTFHYSIHSLQEPTTRFQTWNACLKAQHQIHIICKPLAVPLLVFSHLVETYQDDCHSYQWWFAEVSSWWWYIKSWVCECFHTQCVLTGFINVTDGKCCLIPCLKLVCTSFPWFSGNDKLLNVSDGSSRWDPHCLPCLMSYALPILYSCLGNWCKQCIAAGC